MKTIAALILALAMSVPASALVKLSEGDLHCRILDGFDTWVLTGKKHLHATMCTTDSGAAAVAVYKRSGRLFFSGVGYLEDGCVVIRDGGEDVQFCSVTAIAQPLGE
jgi:hypothetical protein